MSARPWNLLHLGEVLTLQRGFDLPHRVRREGMTPVVSSSGISGTHDSAKVKAPGIVTGRYGTIGEVFYIAEDFWPLNTTLYVRDFKGNDPLYLSYLLRTIDFRSHSGKSGVPGVNRNDLHGLAVVIASPVEQSAIARALSDVDGLVGALDKLTTKKRAMKQAAMQRLLTGKTRLPGFGGEWVPTTMARVGWTYGGLSRKTKADFGVGDAFYVTFLNVLQNVVVDCEDFDQVRIGPGESQNAVRKDDMLFNGTSETAEELAMGAFVPEDVNDLYLNSFCFGFRLHDRHDHDPLFLAYFFRGPTGRRMMHALAQGATRYNMSKGQFLALELSLPQRLEQTAIASVLSDMDAEITALERRRDKIKQIKLGMMQALLTGRIRLVNPAEAEAQA